MEAGQSSILLGLIQIDETTALKAEPSSKVRMGGLSQIFCFRACAR